MHVNVLTLFPEMFPGLLGHSLAGKAIEKEIFSLKAINIRDFAKDKHKTVDDTPYGGGAGMVMRPDVVGEAIGSIPEAARGRLIYLSPRGKPLTQSLVKEISREKSLTLLAGRYEGIDVRVLTAYNVEEMSVGDYILSGGEVAAMVLLDAVIRLLPGVMGSDISSEEESFENGLLEYPHYTRPHSWNGMDVPDVLVSGHHGNVRAWRLLEAERVTKERRPDLWDAYKATHKKGE